MADLVYIELIQDPEYIDIAESVYEFVEIGIQGPAGPTGPAGSGGEETVPTFPIVTHRSSTSLTSGSSVNLDSAIIANNKTGKAQQITLSSSAPCKWELKESSGGVDTTVDVVFTSGNTGNQPTHEWEPPHRDYMSIPGNGTTTFFRVTITNLDGQHAANVYATFYFDEV